MDIFKEFKRLENESRDFGFYWPKLDSVIKQIENEIKEIKEAVDSQESRERLQEEIGDLIHAVFSLCWYCNFDPEQTFVSATSKYSSRFYAMKNIAQSEGVESFNGEDIDFMMNFWDKAKILEKSQ
jgi:uncharacterized protein YabN with tetrapyrrole methylase and pyrophosphatase domain